MGLSVAENENRFGTEKGLRILFTLKKRAKT